MPLNAHPIARQLRQRRMALGITQQALADRIGMSQSRLCSLEWSASPPSFDRLRDWADALGFDVQILLAERGAS